MIWWNLWKLIIRRYWSCDLESLSFSCVNIERSSTIQRLINLDVECDRLISTFESDIWYRCVTILFRHAILTPISIWSNQQQRYSYIASKVIHIQISRWTRFSLVFWLSALLFDTHIWKVYQFKWQWWCCYGCCLLCSLTLLHSVVFHGWHVLLPFISLSVCDNLRYSHSIWGCMKNPTAVQKITYMIFPLEIEIIIEINCK